MNDPLQQRQMDEAIAGVWRRMRPTVLARFAAIEQALAAACSDDLQEELRERAMHEAHKLAGSLGMFGFPDGTTLAREIEGAFRTGVHGEAAARYAERLQHLKTELVD